MRRVRAATFLFVVAASTEVGLAASMLTDGDPPNDTIRWADPFDWYTQWNWDHRSDPVSTYPRGTLWKGGPIPPLSDPAGSLGLPKKASNTNGTAPQYCVEGIAHQTSPAEDEYARTQWIRVSECPELITPTGRITDRWQASQMEIAYGGNCSGVENSGTATTMQMEMRVLNTWYQNNQGIPGPLAMFQNNFEARVPAGYNGFNGTGTLPDGSDGTPLVLAYIMRGVADNQYVDNSYVELNFNGEHAPMDYVWRGHNYSTCNTTPGSNDPECTTQGPYPIVCQQAYETNMDVTETAEDTVWLLGSAPGTGGACPPLKNKTWKSIAFGLLAIMDKDPNSTDASTTHSPKSFHYAVFDGHVWRKLVAGRFPGLINTYTGLPVEISPISQASNGTGHWHPEDLYMAKNTAGTCGDFTVSNNQKPTKVYIKITATDILIYVTNVITEKGVDVPHAWGAAVPRAYMGPFNRIAVGAGPGCELDPATGECKNPPTYNNNPTGGSAYIPACLTYSTTYPGFGVTYYDSMVLYKGIPSYASTQGACCQPNQCVDGMDQLACQATPGAVFGGQGSSCATAWCQGACCPPDGQCTEQPSAYCTGTLGGIYGGNGSRCEETACCAHGTYVWADKDGDADVDMDDFGAFQRCYKPELPISDAGCTCFDRDHSNTIDHADFASFANCATGAGVVWSPGVTPDCVP